MKKLHFLHCWTESYGYRQVKLRLSMFSKYCSTNQVQCCQDVATPIHMLADILHNEQHQIYGQY